MINKICSRVSSGGASQSPEFPAVGLLDWPIMEFKYQVYQILKNGASSMKTLERPYIYQGCCWLCLSGPLNFPLLGWWCGQPLRVRAGGSPIQQPPPAASIYEDALAARQGQDGGRQLDCSLLTWSTGECYTVTPGRPAHNGTTWSYFLILSHRFQHCYRTLSTIVNTPLSCTRGYHHWCTQM